MATTEIEKLERRYAENPQGLTFAPLAEIYRKNGDTARALELLQAGLELHPNYIPASIVLGRCHWDSGDLPAAEAAFSHVLRLDDENVIALKSLADINERLNRPADAQRWLNRLLSIDRGNEEARQQLTRLEEARQQPAPAASEPPKPAAAPKPPPLDLTAALQEPVPQAALEAPEPAGGKPELPFLDTSEPPSQAAPATPNPKAIEDHPTQDPAPVAGLIVQEFIPPPPDAGYRSHPELTQEFASAAGRPDELEVETVDEVQLQSTGAAEFRVPNAAEELMAVEPPAAPPEPPAPAPEPPAPAPVPAASAPEPTPEPEKKRPSYSVRETGGRSVAEYFRTMLASRPAGSSRSVDGTSAPNSVTPAQSTPAAGSDQPAPERSAGPLNGPGEVSFDDFFGAAAGEKSAPKGGPDPGKDDLDQFQSWLQNLKR